MAKEDQELPAMEGEGVAPQKKIKAVEDGFETLIAHRTKRMAHGEKEGEAQEVLRNLFHKHNIKRYVFDDVAYILKGKESIVKAPKDVDVEGNGAE